MHVQNVARSFVTVAHLNAKYQSRILANRVPGCLQQYTTRAHWWRSIPLIVSPVFSKINPLQLQQVGGVSVGLSLGNCRNEVSSEDEGLLTYRHGTVRELCEIICDFFNSCKNTTLKMSASVEAMAQLENNAQTADNLIQEIYSKLSVLQNCNPELGTEVQKLIQENDSLKQEVNEWKEKIILQQIRNGGNPVVRDPKLLERSAVVASNEPVKKEPVNVDASVKPAQTPSKGKAEVKGEPGSTPQPQGKKGKKGDSKTPDNANSEKPKVAASEAPTQGSEEVDVGRLDLRIGRITECTRHPDADALYVEKIDVGEPNVRTVISGLVKHVPLDAMQNRVVVVLCNLKPSKMRGITSEAMVMCASSPEKVEILTPPAGSAPGDVIEVEGYTRRPDAVLNPKKKIFETVAPDLKTNDKKQATFKGVPWTVPGKGFVVSESLCNVNVK